MSTETLHEWEVLDENLTSILWKELPLLNVSADDPANLNLEKIRDILLEYQLKPHGNFSSIPSSLVGSGVMAQPAGKDKYFVCYSAVVCYCKLG